MAQSQEVPALHVEGSDDQHTIVHLLARHGIQLDQQRGPVAIRVAGSDQSVLNILMPAAKASSGRSVGFVLDANGAVQNRWRAICDRLKALEMDLPAAIPSDGFVQDRPKFKSRIGVWIMPDNATDAGKLEHLIETLVPNDDTLFPHAQAATKQADNLDHRFAKSDYLKAVLHCWLAWQREPGCPFGTALKAHFFRHDSAAALRFVDWFKRLYDIP